MKKTIYFLLLCLALPAMACEASQHVVTLPEAVTRQTKYLNKQFLLYQPRETTPGQKHPLIIFLHGMGERGDDIQRIKRHGPPKIVENNKSFQFIVVSPQCSKDAKDRGWWNARDLRLLLDYVKKHYPVDEKRIYLTGLSMGGFGTWAWAAEQPDAFAAIAPICGGGNPALAKKYGKLPIWAFHGDQDKRVEPAKSQVMVDAIKAAGGDAKLTIYPGVGHNSWSATYANPELYKWFLSHTRK